MKSTDIISTSRMHQCSTERTRFAIDKKLSICYKQFKWEAKTFKEGMHIHAASK
jgi:hypothetical protein